jgi:hypothetical protein
MIQVPLSSPQAATLPRKKLPNRCRVALTDQWACLIAAVRHWSRPGVSVAGGT